MIKRLRSQRGEGWRAGGAVGTRHLWAGVPFPFPGTFLCFCIYFLTFSLLEWERGW